MATVSAPAHSRIRAGCWLTSSITVAIELGPAIAGTARGTMNGSPARTSSDPPVGGKIIRMAIRKSTTPPANCRLTLLNPNADRNVSPENRNPRRITNAIACSRTITRQRLAASMGRNELANSGMFPSGSRISISNTKADTKV